MACPPMTRSGHATVLKALKALKAEPSSLVENGN